MADDWPKNERYIRSLAKLDELISSAIPMDLDTAEDLVNIRDDFKELHTQWLFGGDDGE